MDAPSTLVWEHHNGVRAVLDISFAPDMYLKSDHYTGDERIEVTGRAGYVRCNRISAHGIQQPSVELYRDGVVRGFHAIDDHPMDAFGGSTDHALAWLRGDGERARDGRSTVPGGARHPAGRPRILPPGAADRHRVSQRAPCLAPRGVRSCAPNEDEGWGLRWVWGTGNGSREGGRSRRTDC